MGPTFRASVLAAVAAAAVVAVPLSSPVRADGPVPPNAAPDAAKVVLRGRTDLADALRAAIRAGGGTPRSVVLIVDATPYVRAAETALVDALLRAGADLPEGTSWRVAPLGERLPAATTSPGGAALGVAEALRATTVEANTMSALRATLATATDRGAAVVYLADWHFEDDDGTEDLASLLRGRGQTFSVVGSEAAFSRAWNDGLDAMSVHRSADGRGDPTIGKEPFGIRDVHAPWHGGDSAWPAHPGYWHGAPWRSDFMPPALAPASVEDLRERMGAALPPEVARPHALPSSFGPWGLMRVAGTTGGRYVLWSWNPDGRSDVTYDMSRCDLLAPDLRARETIRDDLRSRPLAQAILHAWDLATSPRVGVAAVTAPLTPRFSSQAMVPARHGEGFRTSWGSRSQWRSFVRAAPEATQGMDEIVALLDRAILATGPTPDDRDRRLAADARLFRHVVRAERLSIDEALRTAREVPESWFDERDVSVVLSPVVWVETGRDPERIDADFTKVRDRERAEAVVRERADLLDRYRATPWGETVARNRLYVWEARRYLPGNAHGDTSRSPAESAPPLPPTTPGGSAPAPGPSTGK